MKLLLISVLFLSFYGFTQVETYEARRIGYFHASLQINADSTYIYSEWNHTGQTITDKGVLNAKDGSFFLNSVAKVRRKTASGKSKKMYFFVMKEIQIYDDKIIILPFDEVFPEYCTFNKRTSNL